MHDTTTNGKTAVSAPLATGAIRTTSMEMFSVLLGEDEDVEWLWTRTPAGSYVSGYTIIRKGVLDECKKTGE